ncbi:helix-turn-helix transcriptional regulator [Paenactinomyces guangxiensis]|uniref:Transcriptional regulator n=1 Tax=Paenactinomyces guangxiensis TaxID=1490290 RepID=A0A7W2A818_9BACL|nr:metalloregulator ArsR/SmtB family transcription factor [Paenactinomyces guangxiensis]MBA4493712.1 transcriptional regulator [Paenactinomyces guangxiensis]MBH8590999.1 transcriptional regulator [Paenactinomyces guangxiensis]
MNETGSTRKQIMLMLKTGGPLTVSDMAEQLGVTEMAVRRHLNTLERDGLIGSKLLRQSMGRPTHQYYLTDKSEEHFPKSYHTFTLDLLNDLEQNYGPAIIDQLFKNREKRLTDLYQSEFTSQCLRDRVRALAELQDSKGYMVEWEELEDGSYKLTEFNCPIAQVANKYNQACACEINWFQNLLDAEVERSECKAKGGQNCIYYIRKRKTG